MFNKVTISTHVFVDKSEINVHDYRRRYTIQGKYDTSPRIEYYIETEDSFGIPRHALRLSKSIANEIVDERALGDPINFSFKRDLWDYQQKAIDTFQELREKGGTGFFLEAAPGAGKTEMGIKMVGLLGRTALIVVPKSDLVKQWVDRFVNTTSLTYDDIGVVEGGKADYLGKKVVIGLIHSLIIDRIATPEFISRFGTVLFDECDSSIPPKTFSSAAGMFPAKFRIGMTASATRMDGLHIVFEESLAQFKIKVKQNKTLAPTVVIHRYNKSSGRLPSYLQGMSKRGVLMSMLADNPERNALITNYVVKSYNSDRTTLVLSDRKSQLKHISNMLTSVYKVDPSEIGYFVRTLDGKVLKQEEKDETANKASIILATYGLMSRGTDIPRMETLILALPHSDVRQTLGRIERFMENKKPPVVIDILDSIYKETKNSYRSRINYYNTRGLLIKEVS